MVARLLGGVNTYAIEYLPGTRHNKKHGNNYDCEREVATGQEPAHFFCAMATTFLDFAGGG